MLRFAPSPTGDMHIASLRIAILNYLVSQQKKESFIIRMDDMDQTRNIEGNDTEIMQIMEKFALTHETVFHQSEHLHMYQTLAIKLLEQEKAFICTCTEETSQSKLNTHKANEASYPCSGVCLNNNKKTLKTLKESGTPFAIRLKVPEENVVCNDLIQGQIVTTPNEVGSSILLNVQGLPTHSFASVCDDVLSGVTTIIRAEEYLLSTPKQEHIKMQLGYDVGTTYAHLPRVLNSSGNEMLYTDESSFVKWMFKEGYLPDAIINYLITLGYTEIPQDIFTLPQAIEWFNIEKFSASSPNFDIEKLQYINSKHLEMMDNKELSTLFGFADDSIGELAKLYLTEVSTLKALKEKIDPIFTPKNFNNDYSKEMRTIETIIKDAPMIKSYDEFESYLIKESKLNKETINIPLRYLLTGAKSGPELYDIYPLIKSYLLEVAS